MKALKAEGVNTIEAVLRNCPRKYQEYSVWNKSLAQGTQVTLTGTVRSMQVRDFYRGRAIPNTVLVEVDVREDELAPTEDDPWGANKPRCKVKVVRAIGTASSAWTAVVSFRLPQMRRYSRPTRRKLSPRTPSVER
jgi:RecG-like helicase